MRKDEFVGGSDGETRWDPFYLERAMEYEFRHGTEIGLEMYRFIEVQVTSSAGMLMQCVQEGIGPVLYRMSCMYADHMNSLGDRVPERLATLLDEAVARQIERDDIVIARMGGEV